MARLLMLFVMCAVSAAQAESIDTDSRLRLVRQAARSAHLDEVGLNHRDLYGVIHAESAWQARDGIGRNGVVSHGIAQFEPATARAVGLRNPHDPAQAVAAAAVLMHEAAQWSARKLQGVSFAPGEREARLREGVSIYYTLSTRSRDAWDGRNSDRMPLETRQHIRNARDGARIACSLEGSRCASTSQAAIDAPDDADAPVVKRFRGGLLLSLSLASQQ